MDTIVIINVIASAVAGAILAGIGLRERRAARRRPAPEPIFIRASARAERSRESRR